MSRTVARWLTDYRRHDSIGYKLRAKRARHLMQLIDTVYAEKGRVEILDIGGVDYYWEVLPESFLAERNVSITVVNLPQTKTPRDHWPFKFAVGDGCDLHQLADQSFDIAHSNSVIEHVGDWSRMTAFAREVQRVAPRYFVQTPNYWFPIEPHGMFPLFQYLPKPARVWMVMHFQIGRFPRATSVAHAMRVVESARLLTRKMMQALFEDAEIVTERLVGLPKSFIAIKK
jgi:hypothetical protein